MVAWGRRSCFEQTEISFFVCLVQFKDEGCRVSLKLHLLFLMGIQGTKILYARGWVQRFSCAPSGIESFSLDLP